MTATAERLLVRELVPADATALLACVEDCYGSTYPKRDLYDVGGTSESVRMGTYRGVVAIDRSTSLVVGHIGWTSHAPAAATVEAGATMIRPAYRGGGLLKQLGLALHEQLKASGFTGYVHFPTTAHTVMQRASVSSGGGETGLLLGYLPGTLDVAGFAAPRLRRLAVTVAYQPLGNSPTCAIGATSAAEATWLKEVSGTLGLDRVITVNNDQPDVHESLLTSSYTESRELLTVTVSRIGRDIAEAVNLAAEQPSVLVHVDLDATDVTTSWARRELAAIGFVFGGWLPGWFRADAIRLQRLSSPDIIDFQPDLFTPEAKQILQRIVAQLPAASKHAKG